MLTAQNSIILPTIILNVYINANRMYGFRQTTVLSIQSLTRCSTFSAYRRLSAACPRNPVMLVDS